MWETSVIAAVLAIACLMSCVVWAGFGAVIGRFLANPRARKAFNWCMAGLLVLSVIPVAVLAGVLASVLVRPPANGSGVTR